MSSWFKVYRKIFDSDLWHDVTTFRLFFLLVGQATHKDGAKIAGVELKRGQYIRSYRKLAEDLAYKQGRGTKEHSIRTIKRSIDKLISAGMVSKEETEQGTVFTVLNYAKYQDFQDKEDSYGNTSGNVKETNGKRTGNNNKNGKNGKKGNNKRYSRKQVYDETSDYYQLAIYFYKQIQNNNSDHKEPNLQTWSDDIRKMVELDNRTKEQVKYLMTWVQQDDFEMTNVLSPGKLRKRFDQLIMKVKREKGMLPSNVTPISEGKRKKYNYGF